MPIKLCLPYEVTGIPEGARKRRVYEQLANVVLQIPDVDRREVKQAFRIVGATAPQDALFDVQDTIVYADRNWMALKGVPAHSILTVAGVARWSRDDRPVPFPISVLRDAKDDRQEKLDAVNVVAADMISVGRRLYVAGVEPTYRLHHHGGQYDGIPVNWSLGIEDSHSVKTDTKKHQVPIGQLFAAKDRDRLLAAADFVGLKCEVDIRSVHAEETPVALQPDIELIAALALSLFKALGHTQYWLKRLGHDEAAQAVADMPGAWESRPDETQEARLDRSVGVLCKAVDNVASVVRPNPKDRIWAAIQQTRRALEMLGRLPAPTLESGSERNAP